MPVERHIQPADVAIAAPAEIAVQPNAAIPTERAILGQTPIPHEQYAVNLGPNQIARHSQPADIVTQAPNAIPTERAIMGETTIPHDHRNLGRIIKWFEDIGEGNISGDSWGGSGTSGPRTQRRSEYEPRPRPTAEQIEAGRRAMREGEEYLRQEAERQRQFNSPQAVAKRERDSAQGALSFKRQYGYWPDGGREEVRTVLGERALAEEIKAQHDKYGYYYNNADRELAERLERGEL